MLRGSLKTVIQPIENNVVNHPKQPRNLEHKKIRIGGVMVKVLIDFIEYVRFVPETRKHNTPQQALSPREPDSENLHDLESLSNSLYGKLRLTYEYPLTAEA